MMAARAIENLANFAAIVGAEHVLDDRASRAFYSHDIAGPAPMDADAVVSPGSVEEMAAVVQTATAQGCAIFPRGGGFTYTGCYTPSCAPSVILDLRRVNRV